MILMKYINAENQILGRLSSIVAKMILQGDQVYVFNAGKAVIVGNPKAVIEEYKAKRARGDPYHGPFFPREPDRIFKRTVRGMIPHRTPKGSEAFKRLKVFNTIPSEFSGQEMTAVKGSENKGEVKSMTLEKLSELI